MRTAIGALVATACGGAPRTTGPGPRPAPPEPGSPTAATTDCFAGDTHLVLPDGRTGPRDAVTLARTVNGDTIVERWTRTAPELAHQVDQASPVIVAERRLAIAGDGSVVLVEGERRGTGVATGRGHRWSLDWLSGGDPVHEDGELDGPALAITRTHHHAGALVATERLLLTSAACPTQVR